MEESEGLPAAQCSTPARPSRSSSTWSSSSAASQQLSWPAVASAAFTGEQRSQVIPIPEMQKDNFFTQRSFEPKLFYPKKCVNYDKSTLRQNIVKGPNEPHSAKNTKW